MKKEELREYLATVCEGAILFEKPDFDGSIIGLTSEGQVVYDYQKMIQEYCKDNMCTEEEAADFISYNTLRMIPYFDINKKPVVLTRFEED